MNPPTRKRSFFERLTGSIRMEEDEPVVMTPPKKNSFYAKRYEEIYEDDDEIESSLEVVEHKIQPDPEEPVDAELAIDMYENNNDIVIKTMTAGVKKEDLHITISRDMVTIKGKRENEPRAYQYHYHDQELYWGSFSREIPLPDEVDIDQATATEYHGLVTIKLPKFDKKRKATLKIQ